MIVFLPYSGVVCTFNPFRKKWKLFENYFRKFWPRGKSNFLASHEKLMSIRRMAQLGLKNLIFSVFLFILSDFSLFVTAKIQISKCVGCLTGRRNFRRINDHLNSIANSAPTVKFRSEKEKKRKV